MSYCAQSDLLSQISESQLISLTDDHNTGAVVESIVTQAIADADSEIDGWIGKKYSVPLTTVPDIVKKLSIDISLYNLYSRSRGIPEDRKDRYRNAITFLKSVAKGEATLGEDDPGGSPTIEGIEMNVGADRTFDRDSLEGF